MFDGATRAPDETARGEYSTDLFTRKAVEAIDAHFGPQPRPREAIDARFGDEARARGSDAAAAPAPFFLYLAYQAPHAPVQPSPGFDGAGGDACRNATRGEGRDVYCSMVTALDEGVGRVVDALRAPRGGDGGGDGDGGSDGNGGGTAPWNNTVCARARLRTRDRQRS